MDDLLPTSKLPGMVPTLNGTGWMTLRLDSISEAFVEFAAQRQDECLDIGCAYGVATLPDVSFAPNSFGAILCARALHFLRGPDISDCLRRMSAWLKPGGQLFVVADSPYINPWGVRAQEYERRKLAGDPWPAFVSSFAELLPAGTDPKTFPPFINPLDPDILRRELLATGLQLLECRWLSGLYPGGPPNTGAGAIAIKAENGS